MQRIGTKLRRIVDPAVLAAAELVVAFALLAATAPPAAAQFDFRFPFFDTRPRRPSQPSWPWGQPERREERLAAEIVPLEEAWVEDDAGRVHVAPAHLHGRRVLGHRPGTAPPAGKRFAFQSKLSQNTSIRSTIPWNL